MGPTLLITSFVHQVTECYGIVMIVELSLPRKSIVTGSLFAVLLLALPWPSMAAKFHNTQHPIRDVGTLDIELSIACQHHAFNQIKVQKLLIGYEGKYGRGITGIATKDHNLRDPQGLARDNVTYHFHNDGYSDCQVYTAHSRAPR